MQTAKDFDNYPHLKTMEGKKDLHDKGPGLMFYRFGVDVRKTDQDDLETLLQDYLSRSDSVFPKENDKKE